MELYQLLMEKLEAIERGQELLKDGQERVVALLHELLGQPEQRASADGPVVPNKFRFRGVVYENIPVLQWHLLSLLWGRDAVEIEDVKDELYGVNNDKSDSALLSVYKRLNRTLAKQSCPVSVSQTGGYLCLDVPQLE